FVAAEASPSNPVSVQLDGRTTIFESQPDESTLHQAGWIAAVYLNILYTEAEAIDRLCALSPEILRRSSSRVPRYMDLYADALRHFGRGEGRPTVDALLSAIEVTDPDQEQLPSEELTLYLHVPELELLIYAVSEDARFG